MANFFDKFEKQPIEIQNLCQEGSLVIGLPIPSDSYATDFVFFFSINNILFKGG